MESKVIIDNFSGNGIFSVLVQTFDPEKFEIEHWREALAPGQFDRARELLSNDLYTQVCQLWTPEVVQAYLASLPPPEPEYIPPEPAPVTPTETELTLMEAAADLYERQLEAGEEIEYLTEQDIVNKLAIVEIYEMTLAGGVVNG
jgi:hypothetical protein